MSDQNIRIVIAEDDFLICEEIKRILRGSRYTVIGEACNGEEAVKLVADLQPDLILMDIKMPKMDGLEASRQITEQHPLPIVILTAYESSEMVKQASKVGVGAFLEKPSQFAKIDRAITVAMARHEDLMEMRRLNDELEKHQQNLEETNIALKILLDKRSEAKTNFEKQILSNVGELIEPYLSKLKKTSSTDEQQVLIGILESNLKEITSSFSSHLSMNFARLSPTENQVANLIKQGKRTKDIAEVLNLSPGTISIHRKTIRRKLGLANQSVNLYSFLSSYS